MSKAAGEAKREFRVIFEAHYDAVRAYARRRCERMEDADDVVSETFTIAWRRLRDIPPEAELPWLYGVARRVLSNQRRSERRFAALVERLRVQPQDVATPISNGSGYVVDALSALKPDEQEVLRLAAWEELGATEIARVLGCSPNAASIRLHRAKKRLAALMTGSVAPVGKESQAAGQTSCQEESSHGTL
jgi:RNA polymerase sigma factor (sigma-70 family)